MNGLVFSSFALAVVWRVWAMGVSVPGVGQALALLLLCWLGYRYARSGRVSRAWGILAFLVGWLWLPGIALVAFWTFGRWSRSQNREQRPPCVAEADVAEGEEKPMQTESGYGPESFALLLKVASEYEGRETEYGVPFVSPHGEHLIPLLVQLNECERAVYADARPWSTASEEQCLRWLGLLRTSNREDVDVEIRGEQEVPERLRFYAMQAPRALLEVAAVPQVKWADDGDFGKDNAALLRRLAIEYLDRELPEGIEGLGALDTLVVELVRGQGPTQVLPWTILMLGSFFGETLISLFGGRWKLEGRRVADVIVEIPLAGGGEMRASVFGKVMKLVDNGIEDSTASMARAIQEQVQEKRIRL